MAVLSWLHGIEEIVGQFIENRVQRSVFRQKLVGPVPQEFVGAVAVPLHPVGSVGRASAGAGIDLVEIEAGLGDPLAAKPPVQQFLFFSQRLDFLEIGRRKGRPVKLDQIIRWIFPRVRHSD